MLLPPRILRSLIALLSTSPSATTPIIAARVCLIHDQRLSQQFLASQTDNRGLGFRPARHLNESKAARLTAELVLDNRGGFDLPERFKCLLHIRFGGLVRQVADVEIHGDLLSCVSLTWTFLRTGASFTCPKGVS